MEILTRFVGGFYGQLVSGILWLTSACLAVWRGPRASIIMLVVGGFLIFPSTELLIRTIGERAPVSSTNALRSLGMQIAFVLPLSMPLLLPVGLYRLNWFYPAMMILLGAHYLPFGFLYGMRMFAVLAAFLVGGGTLTAMYFSASFSIGAWYTGTILLVFAELGRMIVNHEYRGHRSCGIANPSTRSDQNPAWRGAQHDLPRVVGVHSAGPILVRVAHPGNQAERRIRGRDGVAKGAGIRAAELRVVQHVHRVCAQFESQRIREREFAADAHVDVEPVVRGGRGGTEDHTGADRRCQLSQHARQDCVSLAHTAAVGIFGVTVACAAWWPARRALQVVPLHALRVD